MTVSDYIWEHLADRGVTHCYYLAGGGSMFLIDALARQDRIVPVAMLHEQACTIASIGHNIYTNTLSSVVCVTAGPGGTNALTGVVAAFKDSTPLLVISGQVPTHMIGKGGPQEVDILSIVKPVTNFAGMACVDGRFPLSEFISLATRCPSGPVWLDVPLDVQSASV